MRDIHGPDDFQYIHQTPTCGRATMRDIHGPDDFPYIH